MLQQLAFNFEGNMHRRVAHFLNRGQGLGTITTFEGFDCEGRRVEEFENGVEQLQVEIRRVISCLNTSWTGPWQIEETPTATYTAPDVGVTVTTSTLDLYLRIDPALTSTLYLCVYKKGPFILAYTIDDGYRFLTYSQNMPWLKV